ncbi:hypothetical protein CONPUDRAFT_161939 [Coniophora puteana RWD-64-598 SS2]|uniref:Uncharacterized protein n=1 Tax=Coniophora puteana (strain RWD-64-598) TaxID=741705 RepID=A0A5M3N8F7_CONPW|nr:uncharacterized protein CONPUDRAFT_161939 [Coniophora puteana RWD-64-598 SS2]EIW87394.1 hypothetical protein CONPUDRAFT_161939 [Coniophora puteana RWD-64-598 SS2]
MPSPQSGSAASLLPNNSQTPAPYNVSSNASATNLGQPGPALSLHSTNSQRMGSVHLTVPPGSRSQTPANQAPWKVVPVLASDVMNKRYDRVHHAKKSRKEFEIEAGHRSFKDDSKEGWTNCVHPEGALYFVRIEDSCRRVRSIFTNADVRSAKTKVDVCSELEKAIKLIFERANTNNVQVDAAFELVLDLDSKKQTVGYYFAVQHDRCLVWVEPFKDAEFQIAEHIRGVEKKGHISTHIWLLSNDLSNAQQKSTQWKPNIGKGPIRCRSMQLTNALNRAHCEAYPHDRTLTTEMLDELTDMVLHSIAERVTSDTSLAPYDSDELAKIQGILDSMKDRVDKKSPHAVCTVARFMRMFARSRFYNFCGQPEARLDADASVYRPPKRSKDNAHPPRSALFYLTTVSMFGMPPSQLNRLEAVWVDRSINTARWKEYLQNSYDEFTGFALYSTVMLAVDVSYLAVPGVEGPGPGSENAATVFTYVSIIAVVGSMTLSLLLSADARRRKVQSAETAAVLLSTVSDSLFGIESLAIMYSLPFALLMWGMVGFLGGLCARIFPGAELYTIIVSAVALGVLGLAVWIPLYTWWRVENGTPKVFQLIGDAFSALLLVLKYWRFRRKPRGNGRGRGQADPEQGRAVARQGQGSGQCQPAQGGSHELGLQQSQTQPQASGSQGQSGSAATVSTPVTQPQTQVTAQGAP